MNKILIIEDDIHINGLLQELLAIEGYQTTGVHSGTEALMTFGMDKFDLILLDLMLPGVAGEVVLASIREKSQIPIIILTAIGDKAKTVELLKLGANDYIVKPFDNDELLARMAIWLRQTEQNESSTFHFKDITLHSDQIKVYIGQTEVPLSKREFGLLECLMKHPKKVFTKNNLYETVWDDHFIGDENTINVHISNLRNKLAKVNPDTEYIQTIWGIGFKMSD